MATFIYTLKKGCLKCLGESIEVGNVFKFKLKPQEGFPETILDTVEEPLAKGYVDVTGEGGALSRKYLHNSADQSEWEVKYVGFN